jgi:flagellar basal body-associated protein FliL
VPLLDERKEKEVENKDEPVKKKRNKLFYFVPLTLALVFLVYFLLAGQVQIIFPTASGGDLEENNGYRYTKPLPEFIVNLADGNRYIKLNLHLAFDQRQLQREIEDREAEIRDRVIILLREKTAEEISAAGGAEILRQELEKEINDLLVEGELGTVLFWDLLIQ